MNRERLELRVCLVYASSDSVCVVSRLGVCSKGSSYCGDA